MSRKRIQFSPDYIICPQCVEQLTRDDVEGFSACPYCDHRFQAGQDLEEFILQPVIEQWLNQTGKGQAQLLD